MTVAPVLLPPDREFVETPAVQAVVSRSLAYLRAGFALHLSGPAGVGKTTIARHVAHSLGRPVVFAQGDDQLTSADLVTAGVRVRRSRVVDNYIHSVTRTSEDLQEQWTDGWLTAACRNGHTVIYDEFTRSRPETNNVLLSVLAERVLSIPAKRGEIVPVHPEFRVIFTSNPAEYVGVYRAADALQDRLVTIQLPQPDAAAQVAILRVRTGLPAPDCERIVALAVAVRQRSGGHAGDRPGLRAALALARVLHATGLGADFSDPAVRAFCRDLLAEGLDDPQTLNGLWPRGVPAATEGDGDRDTP
jgi:gas vesicle protein GvpN